MRLFLACALTSCLLAGCGWLDSGPEEVVDFKFGDLVEPFTPPALAELDAKVEWEDQPVLDSLDLLRAEQQAHPPAGADAEALALRNDSPEANAKILSILGRLPASDDEADWEAGIVRHIGGDIKSSNPLLVSSVSEVDFAGFISFGLFSFDWRLKPFAAKESVVSWQASKDKMYDKIVLRDDLTWSDGTPITAHDVVFSYFAIMSSQVPVPSQRSGTEKLRFVHAYDDHTLVFFHKEPLATNNWNLNFSIIPKHIYEKSLAEDPTLVSSDHHIQYENAPISGGAYNLVKSVRNERYVFEARESYYMHGGKQVRQKPYFKRVTLRVINEPAVTLLNLKAGDIDEQILNPEQWTTQTTGDDFYRLNTKASGEEWTTFHFIWNQQSPFFADTKVRQAMSLAFDHKELIERLRFNLDTPCRGVFNPASGWAPADPPEVDFNVRDLPRAEQLLTEAGWVDSDGDGVRDKMIDGKPVKFEFSIIVRNASDRVDICNLLKRNLAQVGVVCNVTPLEFAVLQDRMQKKEFEASFGGWGTGTYPDTTENIYKTGSERNYGSYSNPEVDKLFEQALRSLDHAERQKIFQQIHRILYADQPYTWLYYQNAFYGFSKKLRGYKFSPRGPYHYGPGFSSIWIPKMM